MITKKSVKSRGTTKVAFSLPADDSLDAVALVADFTGWKPVPFERLKSGKWKLERELEPGVHEFRYRVERGGAVEWWNDEEADGYRPNDQGTENCVLEV